MIECYQKLTVLHVSNNTDHQYSAQTVASYIATTSGSELYVGGYCCCFKEGRLNCNI
jgi:hypothetical protein